MNFIRRLFRRKSKKSKLGSTSKGDVVSSNASQESSTTDLPPIPPHVADVVSTDDAPAIEETEAPVDEKDEGMLEKTKTDDGEHEQDDAGIEMDQNTLEVLDTNAGEELPVVVPVPSQEVQEDLADATEPETETAVVEPPVDITNAAEEITEEDKPAVKDDEEKEEQNPAAAGFGIKSMLDFSKQASESVDNFMRSLTKERKASSDKSTSVVETALDSILLSPTDDLSIQSSKSMNEVPMTGIDYFVRECKSMVTWGTPQYYMNGRLVLGPVAEEGEEVSLNGEQVSLTSITSRDVEIKRSETEAAVELSESEFLMLKEEEEDEPSDQSESEETPVAASVKGNFLSVSGKRAARIPGVPSSFSMMESTGSYTDSVLRPSKSMTDTLGRNYVALSKKQETEGSASDESEPATDKNLDSSANSDIIDAGVKKEMPAIKQSWSFRKIRKSFSKSKGTANEREISGCKSMIDSPLTSPMHSIQSSKSMMEFSRNRIFGKKDETSAEDHEGADGNTTEEEDHYETRDAEMTDEGESPTSFVGEEEDATLADAGTSSSQVPTYVEPQAKAGPSTDNPLKLNASKSKEWKSSSKKDQNEQDLQLQTSQSKELTLSLKLSRSKDIEPQLVPSKSMNLGLEIKPSKSNEKRSSLKGNGLDLPFDSTNCQEGEVKSSASKESPELSIKQSNSRELSLTPSESKDNLLSPPRLNPSKSKELDLAIKASKSRDLAIHASQSRALDTEELPAPTENQAGDVDGVDPKRGNFGQDSVVKPSPSKEMDLKLQTSKSREWKLSSKASKGTDGELESRNKDMVLSLKPSQSRDPNDAALEIKPSMSSDNDLTLKPSKSRGMALPKKPGNRKDFAAPIKPSASQELLEVSINPSKSRELALTRSMSKDAEMSTMPISDSSLDPSKGSELDLLVKASKSRELELSSSKSKEMDSLRRSKSKDLALKRNKSKDFLAKLRTSRSTNLEMKGSTNHEIVKSYTLPSPQERKDGSREMVRLMSHLEGKERGFEVVYDHYQSFINANTASVSSHDGDGRDRGPEERESAEADAIPTLPEASTPKTGREGDKGSEEIIASQQKASSSHRAAEAIDIPAEIPADGAAQTSIAME